VRLEDYRVVFWAVGLIGVLLIASPAIAVFVKLPGGERFSELYVLGPNHMAEGYPYNVEGNKSYSVVVGVGNHLGASAYYALVVKLKNQAEPLPNSTTSTPSTVSPLFEYRFSVAEGQYWEAPLNFAISQATTSTSSSMIQKFTVNNVGYTVNKVAAWDSNSTTFGYQLFLELYVYNSTLGVMQYHNRFVNLHLNYTATP
jgi:uncharacterized membrane protein